MSQSIQTLIKLHKTQLDFILKEIEKVETQKNELLTSLENLKTKIQLEMRDFIGSEYAFMLDKYLNNAKKNQKLITSNLEFLNKQLAKLNLLLNEEYTELKKYEIALENRQKAKIEKDKKNEIKEIDEFNITKFMKK